MCSTRETNRAGVTLNAEKCEFHRRTVKFLGHKIDKERIKADPDNVRAINSFDAPKNRKELQRFFGMVNYLGEFTPTLATDSQKLRKVLGKECEWAWNVEHKDEFEYLKKLMATTPTLAYRLDSSTMLSTDASSYGLGTVIMQKHSPDAHCRPAAYASRTLSTAEQRYAQIEKEALAICWGCERFNHHLAEREFIVETDHKLLVSDPVGLLEPSHTGALERASANTSFSPGVYIIL